MACRFKRTGKRDEIFLATKFGIVTDPDRAVNGTPEYAVQALDASLKRLGTDHVDGDLHLELNATFDQTIHICNIPPGVAQSLVRPQAIIATSQHAI